MLRTCIFIMILIFLGACSREQDPPPTPRWHDAIHRDRFARATNEVLPPYTREQAFSIVLNADQFSPVRYGYGNTAISFPTIAYGTLLEQPDAVAIFQDLNQRATPAGRIYALCGLYTKDQDAFEQAQSQLKPDGTNVISALGGCMIGPVSFTSLVENISNGKHPRNLQATLAQ